MEIITVKCPVCGSQIKVYAEKFQEYISLGKKIKCKTCETPSSASLFKKIEIKPETVKDDTSRLHLRAEEIAKFYLTDLTTGKEYELAEGHNLVGRMTYKSAPKATVPIITDDRGFSRAHFNAEVVKAIDGKYYCYISNASNMNLTYVNNAELEGKNEIGLSDGDLIKSSETTLKLSKKTTYKMVKTSSHDKNDETDIRKSL